MKSTPDGGARSAALAELLRSGCAINSGALRHFCTIERTVPVIAASESLSMIGARAAM
ncbi:hypothetical protein FHS55_000582 [Angulomicrobium tetraedrale]|uniref:Uncharacterized protein n=1 Tax=Ancylobacter tetraedralis TaxID=217068 RepID=A0A839Z6K9_9HYPH|nr:hypothetical protein [Ancylobacter tetraedralis]MBB3769996.1 hypothetical protein [Ancylobacter tetraedralis]